MAILRKQILKQAIWGVEKKTEIMVIPNRYKDTFEDIVDSSDIKPLNMLKLVDKSLYNIMPGFENPQNEHKLNANILDRLQRQKWHCGVPITGGFIG